MKRVTTATLLMILTALASQQASATTYFGMITLTLSVNISSATVVPQGGSIVCTLSASVSDPDALANIESVTATATVANSVATCNLTIPYEWVLSTPGSDLITLEYSAFILPSGSTSLAALGTRSGTHSLPSITGVGASGSHVSLTAETRL